jgi:type II secretory pathway component GspD/PulD (secretin)
MTHQSTIHRFLSRIFTIACMIRAASVAVGQVQPPQAVNNQDERLNFDRAVNANTDEFKILRSDDKQQINQYVTKVYHLEHANPFEIYPYIKGIVSLERGTVATAQNPGPDGRMRRWIQVNVPAFLIPSLDQAIAAYDVPNFISAPGFVAFAYRTRHRNAVEVADFIRGSTLLTPDTKIVADKHTNTIYFQESPSDFKRVYSSILFTDIPQPEIDLELTVVELTEVNDRELGLDWDAWKSLVGGKLTGSANAMLSDTNATPEVSGHGSAWNGAASVGATVLAEFLNYLVDEGKAEVRARTNLTVRNGATGHLDSTSDIANTDYTAAPNGEGLYNLDEKSRSFEGIDILVSPNVAMQSVGLDVHIKLRSPVGFNDAGNVLFSDQKVESHLTLEDGQLARIAGLKRGVVASKTSGVWGLKLVPLVKYLFSKETDIIRDSEVVVFLRPTWSASKLPNTHWQDFHKLVEAFEIKDLLKTNPHLQMSAEDARILQEYFDEVDSM